jgi:hypothetical protein
MADPADWGGITLEDRYGVPPFSILDTRQGYWQERRRRWLALGIQSEIGRGANLLRYSDAMNAGGYDKKRGGLLGNLDDAAGRQEAYGRVAASTRARAGLEATMSPEYRYQDRARLESGAGRQIRPESGNARSSYGIYRTSDGVSSAAVPGTFAQDGLGIVDGDPAYQPGSQWQAGTSIFDPVLADIMYRWFCPPGGTILDPFAGGSVRGIVAGYLGYRYTGIDLSFAQIEANRSQGHLVGDGPLPNWVCGDSAEVLASTDPRIPTEADLVFTCPPYFDLEVYSDDPRDISAMSWEDFAVGYRLILELATARLRSGGFAAVVVSEVRGPDGSYRGLVPLTIGAMAEAGMAYYNEAILLNSVGSGAMRANNQMMASRKLVRLHQNVLVFCKGRPPRGWDIEAENPPSDQMNLGM